MKWMIRRAFNCLMASLLLTALVAATAWGFSTWISSLNVSGTTKLLPAPWIRKNLDNGDWYMSHNIQFEIDHGRVSLSSFPNHGDYFGAPADDIHELEIAGYYQFQPHAPELTTRGIWFVDWNEPYESDLSWALRFSSGPSVDINLPLLAMTLLLLPPSLLWIFFLLRKVFTRRLRIQTNLCLHCGYNLTGVQSDKCPECGADRPLVTLSTGQP